MRRFGRLTLVTGVGIVVSSVFTLAGGQAKPPAPAAAANQLPRTADGKPDFSGIWQALNTAAWDIQDHSSSLASFLGVPPGRGVVEGNEIPYKPEALEQKKKNFEKRQTEDPAFAKCLLPGVPRATYMPYPFEIIQNPKMIGIRYAFARAVRTIDLAGRSRDWLEGWPDFWMGDSRGKWEGDTLVVDVRKLDERTWFDHAGNFHSDALHVVERYSPHRPRSYSVRSDDRGPERVHAAMEDEHAALSNHRQKRRNVRVGLPVRSGQREIQGR